jgi:hypothetical protein
MPIITIEGPKSNRVETVSYEGCVVATFVTDKRVMSDIYADAYHAVVWDAPSGCWKTIETHTAFECDSRYARIIIDASPELQAQWVAHQVAEQKQRDEARAAYWHRRVLEQAMERHNAAVIGKEMVVAKGRKVTIRTKGIVFWVRNGRVGLRTSDRKVNNNWADVVWVNESNLRNVQPFEPPADLVA